MFVDRPNRFIVIAQLSDGTIIRAHAANPGRMWELLYPGVELMLQRASVPGARPGAGSVPEALVPRTLPGAASVPAAGTSAGGNARKTEWSVVAVRRRTDGAIIPLVSVSANRIARELIIPALYPDMVELHAEVGSSELARAINHPNGASHISAGTRRGTSRFDFLVTTQRRTVYMEVKSCTLVAHGVAMFPDAASARAQKHVSELAAIRSHDRAVLFVVHGPSPDRFSPDVHTDPDFAVALRDAVKQGVAVHVAAVETDRDGETRLTRTGIPVAWDLVDAVEDNTGAYVVHLRLDRPRAATIGALGDHEFPPGHYLYVGSARGIMRSRTERHMRKRKRHRWHIDYLRDTADWATVYRIYSRNGLECAIAQMFAEFLPLPVSGFGSSDCACDSHLFFSPTDPRRNQRFVETMLYIRHVRAFQGTENWG
jgi:sugar fermentation stimulation protein A